MRWEYSTLGSYRSELQVPSFIVNECTKGTTVTPQSPKEECVETKDNQSVQAHERRRDVFGSFIESAFRKYICLAAL